VTSQGAATAKGDWAATDSAMSGTVPRANVKRAGTKQVDGEVPPVDNVLAGGGGRRLRRRRGGVGLQRVARGAGLLRRRRAGRVARTRAVWTGRGTRGAAARAVGGFALGRFAAVVAVEAAALEHHPDVAEQFAEPARAVLAGRQGIVAERLDHIEAAGAFGTRVAVSRHTNLRGRLND